MASLAKSLVRATLTGVRGVAGPGVDVHLVAYRGYYVPCDWCLSEPAHDAICDASWPEELVLVCAAPRCIDAVVAVALECAHPEEVTIEVGIEEKRS